MEIFWWIATPYLGLTFFAWIIFALIADGQGETRWALEATKAAPLWPYWLVKLVF